MRLFLVQRRKGFEADYDEHQAFVIRADDARQARKIAHEEADEGKVWMDASKVRVSVVKAEGQVGVVLADFRAG